MEKNLENKLIMSLPGGERRGTSRAGAGRGSMRAASGSQLSRRARVGEPEGITAEYNPDAGGALQNRESDPTSSAGPSVTTTNANETDARRKWSQQELHQLMFCYYKAKAAGPGYMKRLEILFKERNPDNLKFNKFDGNTLTNQARNVLKRQVLSAQVLQEIKTQAERQFAPPASPTINNTRNPFTQQHNITETTERINIQEINTNIITHNNEVTNIESTPLIPIENTPTNDDRRRKWSNTEMEELMFCYFKARVDGSGYIKRLHKIYTQRNPNNPKTNRYNGYSLSTQARTIIKNKMLSHELLDRIKYAAEGTQEETIEQTINRSEEQSTTHINITLQDNQNSINSPPETIDQATQNIIIDNQDPLIIQFLNILAETKEIPVADRKFLPKAKINKTFIENYHKINKYLPHLMEIHTTLKDINEILYAAAKTLIVNNDQLPYTPTPTVRIQKDPAWKRRIQTKIDKFRKELGRLIEIERGASSRRMIRIKDKLYSQYGIQNRMDHDKMAEILKQKIKALAGRIKRYDELNAKKYQNKLFKESQHKFYRSLGNNRDREIKIPSKDSVEQFWTDIMSNPKQYNKEANWINEVYNSTRQVNTTQTEEITIDQVKIAIRKLHNWKTPGIDKLQNYYLKYFTSTHKYLAALYTKIVQGGEYLEDWFTTGEVILIPKNNDTENPKNWRPIACLPSMYKLLTSVLANLLYDHCSNNNIMAIEQRGCRRGARGCKDHLMVNKAILEDAHQSQKNLSMAWIDYQKAFDSVSHEWLLRVLEIYRCPTILVNFLRMTMPSWKTIMTARGTHNAITTAPISIRRGIFQGDSLSPLLFCLAVNPVSCILNKYESKGYKLKDSFWINHLLYMDDLKVYANNRYNLKTLLDSVEVFTNDIGMSFGLDKCNIIHINSGRINSTVGNGHVLLSGETFDELAIGNTYKYLGVHESGKINHSEIRDQTTKEYFKRVKKLLNTRLNSRNIIKGINTYAIPVLLYSFGIINYKNTDLKKIDTKTRKLLAINKAHQQKAEIERLYLPVTQAGRGLINVENMYKKQIVKYKQYLQAEQDDLIKVIVQHDINKEKYSIIKEAREIETELHIEHIDKHTDKEIKEAIIKKQNEQWRNKPLHGRFPKDVLDQANIDKELSFKWIKKQQISSSIESSIFAIQDLAIMTRQHQRDNLRLPVDGKCRLCATKDETTQHIISGCEKLAGRYYVNRHNNLVQYVYWCLARKHNIEVQKCWWQETLTQPKVIENETTKIMWEIPIQTDVTVTHNRPDIIYIDKINNFTYLIDVTVPSDYNIGAKEIEKLSKYHLLKNEISRLWNTQTRIIPIVVGSTGVVAKNITRYIDILDSGIDISILQKQAAIHSSTIISKVLGDQVFVHGNRGETEPPLP